jgi:hypothetical protein
VATWWPRVLFEVEATIVADPASGAPFVLIDRKLAA